MCAKKRALGRGLDSLIVPVNTAESDAPDRILNIPLGDLRPNANQPRADFDDQQIAELAQSVREVGILQPLLVRHHPNGYELIAGERRLRAAQSIGLDTVPCRVTSATDEKSMEMALIENLQREDLNPLEEARAFQSLLDQFGLTQEDVATRVGKNRSTVANSLRLLNLPLDIQEDLRDGRLSPGHARALLSLPDPPKQRNLRNLIIARGLSVRESEAKSHQLARPKKARLPLPSDVKVHMRTLQEDLSMRVGVPVFIKALSAQSGKVEIHYRSLEDFELITDFFGIEKQ